MKQIIIIFLGLAVITGFVAMGGNLAGPGNPEPVYKGRIGPKYVVRMLHSSEKADWLEDAKDRFVSVHPDIRVELISLGSFEGAEWLLKHPDELPEVWSPADNSVLDFFHGVWPRVSGQKSLYTRNSGISLIESPLVLLIWDSAFDVFARAASGTQNIWQSICKASTDARGWSAIGGTGKRKLRFRHADPTLANSGLMAIYFMAEAALDDASILTKPQNEWSEANAKSVAAFRQWFRTCETAIRAYPADAPVFHSSTKSLSDSFGRYGPEFGDVVVTYEQLAVTDPNLIDGTFRPRIYYPSPTVWIDHPVVLLQKADPDKLLLEKAAIWRDFLLKPEVQQQAPRFGFRPAVSSVLTADVISSTVFGAATKIGWRLATSGQRARPPDGLLIVALQQVWKWATHDPEKDELAGEGATEE